MKKIVVLMFVVLLLISTIGIAMAQNNETEDDGLTYDDDNEADMDYPVEEYGIAEEFILNSPTYTTRNGYDLKLDDYKTTDRGEHKFYFEFTASLPGYGEMTEDALTQVTEEHEFVVVVFEGEVVSANIDEKWDVLLQEEIEESTSIDDEVETFAFPRGAEVRLLQLEEAISRNIAKGNEVITRIQEKDPEADVSGLEDKIADLEALLEEVKATEPEGEPSELAAQFVELKSQAIDLAKDFREEARTFFSEEDQERIREEVRERATEKVAQVRERVQERVREFNAERLNEAMERLGIEDEEIVQKIKSGEASLGEVRSEMVKKFKEKGLEAKDLAKSRVQEAKARAEVFRQNALERVPEHIRERIGIETGARGSMRINNGDIRAGINDAPDDRPVPPMNNDNPRGRR